MPESEHLLVRRIDFVDTDMAGIMHFSNYYRLMEAAETSFFRSLGLPLFEEVEGRMIGWPRVRSRCDYHAPLRFNDTVEVHLFVKEIRTQALTFFFRFRKRRPDGSCEAVARGELTTVCATLDPATQAIVAVPLPAVVRERLEVASKSAYRR